MFAPAQFLSLEHTAHPKLFEDQQFVWNALKQIASYLQFRLKPAVLGELVGRPFISANVFVGRGTVVEQGAVLKGPAWIGENCHIRSGCYVRENVVVGNGVVMGNSCEFKNSIIFDEAEVPHFNYVGDSILGFKAHLGAGVILSNVKLDRGEISVATDEGNISTGLTKFGAIVGDRTEIGCNAVINPGSVLGRDCLIYPNVNFRGVLPESRVVKLRQEVQILERRDLKK
jgi:UDP-N-acetylglucosamine diphosphorylase / glucose-1-phosphate thymidylyltransferase / UDP-N-acetylgalactosamine diphosphorylase / glucosamine-1-phosphate N-acetyltransferase / galactosamine-1-phosphate N-acetyltransferase